MALAISIAAIMNKVATSKVGIADDGMTAGLKVQLIE